MLSIAQKKIKNKIKIVALVLLGIYIMIGTSLYYLQEKLMFFPTTLEDNYAYNFNYPFEELFLKTDDSAVINAVHFKNENPKGIIFYLHGNAGDLSRWGKITEYFVAFQYDVLVIDYRTYGKSKGILSEEAFYKDSQYCYNYILNNYKENQITIYGRSLGTGIATYLASKNKPKQLILETPYYSINDVAKDRFPIFPVSKFLKYKFPTYSYITNVSCPISIFHGTEDRVVPISSANKLYKEANANVSFNIIEGGGHNNLVEYKKYQFQIEKLLK
jgi:pimeloyl-ACP methyl ester carboxylesterase